MKKPAAAAAARGVNTGIDVDVTGIQVVGKPGDQLKVGDSVTVKGTWNASKANPKAGDEFSVQFPKEIKLGDNPEFKLGTDPVWAKCALVGATNSMTCVLTDQVTAYPEDVYGDFEVSAKAVEYTTAEDVTFTINGDFDQKVALPGGGGISDGKDLGDAKKSGKLQPDKQAVRWTIDIPGADLIALNAAGTGAVTLTDTLSANMKVCADGRVNAKLLSGRPGDLKEVAGGVAVTQAGGAGTPVSVVLTNGAAFKADQLYRVEYTSCSASGVVDALGTTYENSVQIGDKPVGAEGVGQDWKPTEDPSKIGTLLKGERYQKAEWTVMVPGTFIRSATENKVTLDETLGGAHEVCAAGLGLTIKKANYLPGANGAAPARTDVTSAFTINNAVAAGAKAFTVDFTPKDMAAFADEQYYYVTYKTCVTAPKVPDSNDKYTNAVSVNGVVVPPVTAQGPAFNGGKTGTLNTVPRKVAGVDQPAGTTLDWKVEVPGQHLEGLEAPAVIADSFSNTMTVCEVGADLKANLNLKVIARDFLGGTRAVAERDLTAATGVARTATGLDFTLPKEAGDYNRETRYFIEYTLCTTSGGTDQRGTVYENSLAYNGKTITSRNVTQEWGGSGTGQGVTRGSFSLLKLKGNTSEPFPDDTEFTVLVEEFAPGQDLASKPESSYKVKVKADGTPVSGTNNRGAGWQIRLSEVDLPTVAGVYFEQGKFSAGEGVTLIGDGTKALVTIAPKSNVQVKLVNRALLGTAKITKTVTGNALGELTGFEDFVFKAQVDVGGDKGAELREFTLRDGQSYDLGKLPIGAKVTFTEVQPTNTDRVTWSAPVIEPKTLTIGADAAANTVSVTNEAKITQGTFELKKKLDGPQAFNKGLPTTFDVVARWTDADNVPQTKTLTLPKDGTAVPFGLDLPGGTEVTLTEVVPADGNGLAWGVPKYTGTGTTGAGVVTIGLVPGKVEVTNYIDVNDGTLRVAKQVSGEAAESVGADVEFDVEARWQDGAEYKKAQLKVKQGASTPLGVDLPVGTEVTFTETGRPDVAGVEWGTTSWGTNPAGESWLISKADGTATGIVSDDPTEGRLITLTNEALWKFGSLEFTKFIFDGDAAEPAKDADLPAGAEFQVRIEGINPALPEGTEFPAVGETITLNAENGFTFKSGDVLPRGTVVTFSEVDPNPLPGIAWARPYYLVSQGDGEAENGNTAQIAAGEETVVQIQNRPIPTADVDISKIVTGPKGAQVTKDPSTTFQVTATWTDIDDEARSCVLDVKPGVSATPTAQCDAAVIDGRVQFPLNTKIAFVETGAHTDVTNVNWGEVLWSVKDGSADIVKIDSEPTGTSVTLTGDANTPVTLGLENKSSSKGLIIIPIPIPLPPFGGGSLIPGWPGSVGPNTPGSNNPGSNTPATNAPGTPGAPNQPGGTGHNGAPGKPAPAKPDQSSSLPVTGANVIWLVAAALALIAGGAWLTLRNRRRATGE